MDTTSLPRSLAPGQALRRDLPSPTHLAVNRGRLWLTRPGDRQDHFVTAGEQLLLPPGRGLVVECDSPEPAELHWSVLRLADHVWQRWRRHLDARRQAGALLRLSPQELADIGLDGPARATARQRDELQRLREALVSCPASTCHCDGPQQGWAQGAKAGR